MKINLDKRLLAVASFVRNDAVLADVGTDHAYLPIYLLQNGIIKSAIASDINEGPLLSAKRNIYEEELTDKVTLVLCDGLRDVMKHNPTDVVIAGMGGELICKIISEAQNEICSRKNIRLILQPMTHQGDVRKFLYKNGFEIIDEKIVFDGRKNYQIICAEYTGKAAEITEVEALLGKVNVLRGGEDFVRLCDFVLSVLNKSADGKAKANLDNSSEKRMIDEIINLPTYKKSVEVYNLTHLELYNYLSVKFPPSLSESWDNDGLMCCTNHQSDVKKVLLALDATYEAIVYAAQHDFDIIFTHHPLVFRSIRAFDTDNFVCDKLSLLIKSGITVMSFHTRLDAAEDGVNDALAEKLGLLNITPVSADETESALLRMGNLFVPISLSKFAALVKKQLGCKSLSYVGKGQVSKVAVLGGSGKDFVALALKKGADTFVCGEIDYNSMLDASEQGLNVIAAGHFATENLVLNNIGALLENLDIPYEIFSSNKIHTI